MYDPATKIMDKATQLNSEFAGDLPSGCPPLSAKPCINGTLWRLVSTSNPSSQDFISVFEEGAKPRTEDDLCVLKGVSYFHGDRPFHKIKALKALPTLKNKTHAAKIEITSSDAMVKGSDPNKKGHFCVWRSSVYFPHECVMSVEKL